MSCRTGSATIPTGSGKDCDLDHTAAAARADVEGTTGEQSVACTIVKRRNIDDGRGHCEQSADCGQPGRTMSVGQKAEVANPSEAARQYMKRKRRMNSSVPSVITLDFSGRR